MKFHVEVASQAIQTNYRTALQTMDQFGQAIASPSQQCYTHTPLSR
jgi:hypothetical protein